MSTEPPSNIPCAQSGARCPVCGEPNCCRMESGEAYKGPCWCELVTVSGAAMRRISAELAEPRCLCPGCMEAIARNPEITYRELAGRLKAE